LAAEWLHELAA